MSALINITRVVDGTVLVVPMPLQGVVFARIDDRRAVVPTARAYQLIHLAGIAGVTAQPGTPAWKYQVRQMASAVLGDWQ